MLRNVIFALLSLSLLSCDELNSLITTPSTVPMGPPSQSEIASGLKEALIVGAQNSVLKTSMTNGFFANPKIKIPFPPEAQAVADKARDFGFDQQVDQFVETMNHGAEKAAAKATPIFIDAIKGMTFQDVYEIWQGEDDAATQYLRRSTSDQLKQEFSPIISSALNEVELTRYWNPIIDTYNKIPFVEKQNPDLQDYVLDKTLDGLFITLAEEERSIREDPAARVTDLLKRVFGYQS